MTCETCAVWSLGQFAGADLGDERLKKDWCE